MTNNTREPIAVALVADSRVIRVGWTQLIKEASQLELLGTYLHEEAQNESTIIDGEGIIIDASMHELRCLHTIRHIRGKDPDIPIVVVSSRSGDTRLVDVQDIRRTGATAVLRISRMEEAELIDAVVAALGESRC